MQRQNVFAVLAIRKRSRGPTRELFTAAVRVINNRRRAFVSLQNGAAPRGSLYHSRLLNKRFDRSQAE